MWNPALHGRIMESRKCVAGLGCGCQGAGPLVLDLAPASHVSL